MKKMFIKYLPYGLIAGFILTLLLMGQMRLLSYSTCASYAPVYSNIRRVDCIDYEYGYPLKFIRSESHVDVNTLDASKTAPILLAGSSVVRFRPLLFAADAVIWSAVSLAVLLIIAGQYRPRGKK